MKMERREFLQAFGVVGLALLTGCKPGSFLDPTVSPQPSLLPTDATTTRPISSTSTPEATATEYPNTRAVRLAFPSYFFSETDIPSGYQEELEKEEIRRIYDSQGNPVEFGFYGEQRPYESEGPTHPNYNLSHVFVSGYPRAVFQDRTEGHYWLAMEVPYERERQIIFICIPNQGDSFPNLELISTSRNIEDSMPGAASWRELAQAVSRPEAVGNQLVWGFQVDPQDVAAQELAQALKERRAISSDVFVVTSFAWVDENLFG